MLHAVSYALADSVNVLLIGVLFAVGVMHPKPARYGKIAAVLVLGDWLGVLLLSAVTMLVFDGIGDLVHTALESPVIGLLLIAVGLMSIVMAFRGGGDSSAMVARLAKPLRKAGLSTFASGMVLGLVQSATSLPFFVGLGYLSTGGFSTEVRYFGLIVYATLALSLPIVCAWLIGLVLKFPNSVLGRGLASLRTRQDLVTRYAGYGIGVLLIGLGALSLAT